MKIVITGCAGFIGANFSQYYLTHYPTYNIVGIDCLTYAANTVALSKLKANDHFTFYQTDICNRAEIRNIFQKEKPDIVVNFAAESHVDRSIENPDIFIKTNVLGTQILLDACLNNGIKRFHQISTDEVYGDLPLESKETFIETSPLKPSSPYSASKAAADLLTLSYYKTYQLPVTISRSSNNYGKYQHTEKLIPKAIFSAINKQAFPLYGNGLNVREWLHVDDHSRAIDCILHRGTIGEIYNIGSGCFMANAELVKVIFQKINVSKSLVQFVEDRKGHDKKYALDCSKLQNQLGWKPQENFDKQLEKLILWYQNEFAV